jgi:uncharacterized protein YidB (DUF937 family)
MDFMKIGTQVLMQQFTKQGGTPNEGMLQQAMSSLFGGGASGGGFNIASLIGKMQQGGMAEQVGSWLGTGANQEMSADQVEQTIGAEQIQGLASQMGMDASQVKSSLQQAIPQIIDQASPTGALPSSLGDIAGMASKLFGK